MFYLYDTVGLRAQYILHTVRVQKVRERHWFNMVLSKKIILATPYNDFIWKSFVSMRPDFTFTFTPRKRRNERGQFFGTRPHVVFIGVTFWYS